MGPGLLGYTVRRLLWAIPVLLVISFLVFAMLRLAPGDPVLILTQVASVDGSPAYLAKCVVSPRAGQLSVVQTSAS